MLEIICPNCDARYQVPETAIGPSGRQVTCSSCRHQWMAYPDDMPRATPRPHDPETAPASSARGRQMAEIRQMLDEVQSADQRRSHQSPVSSVPPAPDEGPIGGGYDEDDDDTARFMHDKIGNAQGQEARIRQMRAHGSGASDTKKLMQKHKRKYLRKQAEDKRGTGTGATGFLFVVMVASIFTGLYTFHPYIIAQAPQTEPAMLEYVAAIDTMRANMSEQFGGLRSFIEEKVAELRGAEDDGS